MSGRLVSLSLFLLSSISFAAAGTRNARRDGVPVQRPPSVTPSQAGGGIGIYNNEDINYLVNITLGGQEFTVALDSGSSDLWVMPDPDKPLKISNSTGLYLPLTYGKGVANGTLEFAELKLGNYTIPSQAFFNVNETADIGGIGQGILGIAFDSALIDLTELALRYLDGNDTTLGLSPLANLLAENASQPFFDISLGRESDLDGVDEGTFLIGTHATQYAAVADAPKLAHVTEGRWSAVLEGLSVNGNNYTIKTKSNATNVPAGQLSSFLDTGTSLPQVPVEIAQAIYEMVPGAVRSNSTSMWYLPCRSSLNLTWYLGGQAFPMHPLDLSITANGTWTPTPDSNVTVTLCVGAYQESAEPPYPGVDVVFGDSFLRNVYASFNFGPDYKDTQSGGNGSYIQLLSTTTDLDAAWLEFQLARSEALAESPFVIDPAVLEQIPGAIDSITLD